MTLPQGKGIFKKIKTFMGKRTKQDSKSNPLLLDSAEKVYLFNHVTPF